MLQMVRAEPQWARARLSRGGGGAVRGEHDHDESPGSSRGCLPLRGMRRATRRCLALLAIRLGLVRSAS